jgi:eukaryotic-like serine/threonine-protein kinase
VVLETLQGETLSHLIRRTPRGLSATDVCHLGLHVASAVGYLHRHDVVHLDLKPSNVIAHAGTAKVIDLSLARPPGPVPVGVGTREYLSPEQARGGEAGPASDVWGIGATLFAAATGTRPFAAIPDGYEQLRRRAAPVGEVRPRYPRTVRAAVDACLELDPADRPALPDLVECFADHVRIAA